MRCWRDGGIGSFIKSAFHATPDLIFQLVFQANSGWVQQQLIATRREVKYLFSSFFSFYKNKKI
ncbi:MAG: hypothetical protein A2169_11720 [Deltaproteobacteria bacterium RBG_13_47_9]|nr:MAG: hypothetical protein A2169_11720 [Deltaproteobacteria bacterium RBG_13_47_9]